MKIIIVVVAALGISAALLSLVLLAMLCYGASTLFLAGSAPWVINVGTGVLFAIGVYCVSRRRSN